MAGIRVVLSAAVVLLVCALGPVDTAPVISAPWGQISGEDVTSPGGRAYSAYLAIPYALPPLGDRRFAKPVVHPGPGSGRVFSGSNPGPACPQLGSVFQSEDCLTLDVYVPATTTGSYSIMVWIHGGGFINGGSHIYTPSLLVTENDVIVVVVQYRLGILGFLSSGDNVVSGNYGLMDQTLALRWVKDNIKSFGGDPNSVTIFGESAGAAGVGMQLLTPYSKGLFSRAILQSGSPTSLVSLNRNPAKAFHTLANKTGCLRSMSWSDSAYYAVTGGRQLAEHQRILECLRGVDFKTFEAFVQLVPEGSTQDMYPWAPVVDGDYLPREPLALLDDQVYCEENEIYSRDVILGMNNDEGSLLLQQFATMVPSQDELVASLPKLAWLKRKYLSEQLEFQFAGEGLEKDARGMKTLLDVGDFFYSNPGSGNELQALQDTANIMADTFFTAPLVTFARGLLPRSPVKKSGKPSVSGRRYVYLFNHYPAVKAGLPALRGMYHAEDLAYEFDPVSGEDFAMSAPSDDASLGTSFRSIISNFAKTGNPQFILQSGEVWPEYTLMDQEYLSLAPTPVIAQNLYAKRVALWLDLMPSLVNSTRRAMCQPSRWMWDGDGDGNDCITTTGGVNYYNQNNNYNQMPSASGQTFFVNFKGRLNFYKLPNRGG